jgi:maleate isomerase
MTSYRYDLTETRPPQLGLIALQSDESIEADFRRMLPEGLELMVSRVASDLEVSAASLRKMEAHLTGAAAMFPSGAQMSAVAYGCTSGTAQIGQARIGTLIRAGVATPEVTEPVSALIAACAHLGIRRLAMLSPYVEEVSARLRDMLAGAGIASAGFGSFNEPEEAKVVRIAPRSIFEAGCMVAGLKDCDALFLSCTNLRTLDVIDKMEAQLGMPVLSSNQVLAWHLCGLAGNQNAPFAPGRLWRN